jgi:hypothetical protein
LSRPEIKQARDGVVAALRAYNRNPTTERSLALSRSLADLADVERSLADLADVEKNGKDATRSSLYDTASPTADERLVALESRVDQALRRLEYMLVLLEKICAGR